MYNRASLTVNESIITVSGDLEFGRDLAEQRNNGLARVATNDRNSGLGRVVQARELLGKSLGTNNIQGGDTEQALGIKDAGSLENLGGNGNGGVDRVRDDKGECIGTEFSNALDQVAHNSGIDLEEIVASHTGLAYISRG